MPRPKSPERIRGPYEDRSRSRWRVERVYENGAIERTFFRQESDAIQYCKDVDETIDKVERTTETAREQYRKFLKQKGNADESVYSTMWALQEFFPDTLALAYLTAKRCKGLYNDLRTRPKKVQRDGEWIRPEEGDPLAADSHRRVLREVKTFLEYCVEQGWIAENPARGVKPVGKLRPRGKSLGKAGNKLRLTEARALYSKALELATAGDSGASAVLVGLLLGLRASEICKRQVRDVDMDQYPADVLQVTNRKNGEDLTLEAPEVLRPVLLALAEGKERDDYLFANGLGRRRSRWWVLEQVERLCRAANVPVITAHALRGLLATLTLERGLAGHLVAATLGHDERVTHSAYAAPGSAELGTQRRGLVMLEGGKR